MFKVYFSNNIDNEEVTFSNHESKFQFHAIFTWLNARGSLNVNVFIRYMHTDSKKKEDI